MNKFRNYACNFFKQSVFSYSLDLQNLKFEGAFDVVLKNKFVLVDFGLQTPVELFLSETQTLMPKVTTLLVRCNLIKHFKYFHFRLIVLQNFFLREIFIKKNAALTFKLIVNLFLKQRSIKKFYIKGRILNLVRGGYSVGVGGLIGFLPASHSCKTLAYKLGELSSFYVASLNKLQKKFVLSQRRIARIVKKKLVRLKT